MCRSYSQITRVRISTSRLQVRQSRCQPDPILLAPSTRGGPMAKQSTSIGQIMHSSRLGLYSGMAYSLGLPSSSALSDEIEQPMENDLSLSKLFILSLRTSSAV